MLNIKVRNINHSINMHRIKCPHCNAYIEYTSVMPFRCHNKHCYKPLPDIERLLKINSGSNLTFKFRWHFGATDLTYGFH
jgi:hypothetical protein